MKRQLLNYKEVNAVNEKLSSEGLDLAYFNEFNVLDNMTLVKRFQEFYSSGMLLETQQDRLANLADNFGFFGRHFSSKYSRIKNMALSLGEKYVRYIRGQRIMFNIASDRKFDILEEVKL
jgi:hypothetical protein